MGLVQAIHTTNSGLLFNGSKAAVHAHNIVNSRSENYAPVEIQAVSQAPKNGGGVQGIIPVKAHVEGLVDATDYAQSLSEVDVTREYTSMLQAKHAYAANAATMKGIDELLKQIPGLR